MQRLLALVAIAAILAAVPAQTPGTGPKPDAVHPEKQRIAAEVARKRDAMRAGQIERFNVRVRLRLHNGSKLIGLVKSGRFVEREHGIDFVESDRHSPEAGVRLWYFDETNSFVFLRWADIESHKVLAKLTDEEVRAIEVEVTARDEQRARERREAAEKAAAAKAAAETEAAKAAEAGKGAEPASPPPATETPAEVPPLLVEFPTDEWSEARAEELERRKITVGVYPNAQEKRFLEVLAEWKKARDDHASRARKKDAAPPSPGGAPGSTPAPAKK